MKSYGARKATEFTKKQVGVIYRAYKEGSLEMKERTIKAFYNLADFYGYDDNRSVEADERIIKGILESVFSKDMESAQNLINEFEEQHLTTKEMLARM